MSFGQRMLRLWPWLAAILSGIFYRLCFAPFDVAWLCWIALVPLLAAVWFPSVPPARPWLRHLLLGYLAGVTFFWFVFSWLQTVTVPGWFLVGLYMGIYPAAWAWLAGQLRPGAPRAASPARGLEAVTQRLEAQRAAGKGIALPQIVPNETSDERSPWLSSYNNLRLGIVLAAAWVALETVRGWLFSGWGWNSLGVALHGQWGLIQIADLTGVAGLSFLVCLANVVLVAVSRRFAAEAHAKTRRPHFELTLTLALIVGVLGYGFRAVQERPESLTLRVAALQPNVPREEKFSAEHAQATFDQFSRLSLRALQAPVDLLVWPESSMPDPIVPGTASTEFLHEFASQVPVDLLTGVILEEGNDAYNAALFIAKGSDRFQLYRKVHLVPFGEYVPGRHTIPGIGWIVGDQVPSDFAFGKEYTVFRLTKREVRLAPLICFEDTIGELTRQFVLQGANLLGNVTNDGWFLRSAGSQQHLDNAVFRCVETRLPMIRSGNTGVTCFVNEFGRVTRRAEPFREDVLIGDVKVPVDYEPTFYVRHGEWFARFCSLLTAAALAVILLRGLSRRSAK